MTEAIEFRLPPPAFDRHNDSDDLGFCARLRLFTYSNKAVVGH